MTNNTLIFDALLFALIEANALRLILDTKGIKVWCIAGKRTFRADDRVYQIESSSLSNIVSHKKIIFFQLEALRVSAHEDRIMIWFNMENRIILEKTRLLYH